jgi:hypothetical protein
MKQPCVKKIRFLYLFGGNETRKKSEGRETFCMLQQGTSIYI